MSTPNPYELVKLNDPDDVVILNYINKHNDGLWADPLTLANALLGTVTDLTKTNPSASPNSQVKVISLPNRGYKGTIDVKYNRIDLGEFIEGWLQGNDFISKLPINPTVGDAVDYFNTELLMGLDKRDITNASDVIDLTKASFNINISKDSKLFNKSAVVNII